MKCKGCYSTSKYSVPTTRISMTIQECVRKAMLSVERSALCHHHFVEIALLSFQFSLLMDLLLLRLSKARWMMESSMTSYCCRWYAMCEMIDGILLTQNSSPR